MTYYTNGFGDDNAYKSNKAYRQQKNNEPHPTTSYLMYSDLIKNAKEKYNMEMLFTDFLCYRQPAMEQYQDVPDGEEGGHLCTCVFPPASPLVRVHLRVLLLRSLFSPVSQRRARRDAL